VSLEIESRLVVESTLSLSSVMYPFIYGPRGAGGGWRMDGGLYSSTVPPPACSRIPQLPEGGARASRRVEEKRV